MSTVTYAEAMRIALQHHAAGRLTEAETICRQLLKAKPGNADALHLLGVIAFQSGYIDAAAELLEKAVAADGQNSVLLVRYGQVLRRTGRGAEAIETFRRATTLNKADAEAWFGLAEAQSDLARWDDAAAALGCALALKPTHPEIWSHLAFVQINAGRVAEGIESARRGLSYNSGTASAHRYMALGYRRQGRLDDAEAALREAIKLRPMFIEAMLDLGDLLIEKDKAADVEALFAEARRLAPRHPLIRARWPEADAAAGKAKRGTGAVVPDMMSGAPSGQMEIRIVEAAEATEGTASGGTGDGLADASAGMPANDQPAGEPPVIAAAAADAAPAPVDAPALEPASGGPDIELPSGGPDNEVPSGKPDNEVPSGEPDNEVPSGEPDNEVPSGEPDSEQRSEASDSETPAEEVPVSQSVAVEPGGQPAGVETGLAVPSGEPSTREAGSGEPVCEHPVSESTACQSDGPGQPANAPVESAEPVASASGAAVSQPAAVEPAETPATESAAASAMAPVPEAPVFEPAAAAPAEQPAAEPAEATAMAFAPETHVSAVPTPEPTAPAVLEDLPLAERLALCREIAKDQPGRARAHLDLGLTLLAAGNRAEATVSLRRALELDPRCFEAARRLGHTLRTLRRLDEAAAAYREALAVQPDATEVLTSLGGVLLELGRLDEAAEAHRRVLTLHPQDGDAHVTMGDTLLETGDLDEAEKLYRQALKLEGDRANAHARLGQVLHVQGRLDEAETNLRQALALRPDEPAFISALLCCVNQKPDLTPEQIADEHRRQGGRLMGAAAPGATPAHNRVPSPDRQLRIGYVSPDFRRHPVSSFFELVLNAHDRSRAKIFCYANVTRPDAVTTRLRGRADGWRDIVGLTDAEVADQIRTDGIDILIDLAGHSPGNRLGVFALKPAPVQATWLGYANTTGLPALDYRLSDTVADPQGTDEALYTETVVHLPGGSRCFLPPVGAPDVGVSPADTAGHVTFGVFACLPKITPQAAAAWAAILERVPQAQLLIQSRALSGTVPRRRLLNLLGNEGIDSGRVELVGRTGSPADQLALYNRVDIALDTFPCNEAATMGEALWMGVPVITVYGERLNTRIGASLLTQAGLPELIAGSVDDYVAAAVALAENTEGRTWLRGKLRTRLRLSPLCDAKRFTRILEESYRELWRRWCASVVPETRRPAFLSDRIVQR